MLDVRTQHLLRDLTPRVLSAVMRRYRDFAGCEDAVQEALVAAARTWPSTGLPDDPLAWLIRTASRRVTDELRQIAARRLREQLVVSLIPADEQIALAADRLESERDDTLDLLIMCCHPSLSPSSQIALTLRAVGGLTTAEIARAFLVPEATMAQRLSRAKQTIKSSGVAIAQPTDDDRAQRLGAVMHVLYLIFNEGYAATSGAAVHRIDLSREAIRVTRLLLAATPAVPEIEGLLALMLLTDARRAARAGPLGELIPLDQQDRTQWDRDAIAEGTALLDTAMARGAPGPFQIQAAIAALHDDAPSTAETDWPQIVALYDVLLAMTDSPMARLSRAIAVAMVDGATAGLALIDELAADPRLAGNHRIEAARGHLHERAGDRAQAIACFRRAAAATTSTAERDFLLLAAARLAEGEGAQ